MSTIRETIPAGAVRSFYDAGDFMRLQDGTGVNLSFFLQGVEQQRSESVTQGYARKVPRGFDRLDVHNPTAADIAVHIFVDTDGAEIDYAGATGSVDIGSITAPAVVNSRATVLTSAVSTLSVADANRKYLAIQNNSATDYIRFTVDGIDPTASQGFRLAPGDYWDCPGHAAPLTAIKAIAETGTGAAVEVMAG